MSSDTTTSGPPRGDQDKPGDTHTPGLTARRILRAADRATLTTLQRPSGGGGDHSGAPYPSLVLTALDHDGTPLLCLSTLADHTRNIAEDPRVGLLFDGTQGLSEPLAGPRVSILGRTARSELPRHRARFLARHPGAARYLSFGDFAVYRVAVEGVHLVSGFGRVHWLSGAEVLADAPQPDWENGEAAAVAATVAAAARITRDGWTVTGADPDGLDRRRPDPSPDPQAAPPGGGLTDRIAFPHPIADPAGIPALLHRLFSEEGTLSTDGAASGD